MIVVRSKPLEYSLSTATQGSVDQSTRAWVGLLEPISFMSVEKGAETGVNSPLILRLGVSPLTLAECSLSCALTICELGGTCTFRNLTAVVCFAVVSSTAASSRSQVISRTGS